MSTIVTMEQLDAAADAALDYHMDRDKVFWQNEQNRPLLRDLTAAAKPFPGGKALLTERVAGEYVTQMEGFQFDDSVDYGNPGKLRTASYPWKLLHAGINVTHHELLMNGISVTDDLKGDTKHLAERDAIALADLFEYKMQDMTQGMAKNMDEMYWQDGTQDPLVIPGIRSLIVDVPTSAVVVGGIDQSANVWWQNYAALNISSSSSPSSQNLVQALQVGIRQMRRYGTPKHKAYAGGTFMNLFEQELRSKGNYTLDGWAKTGSIDASVADLKFKGVEIEYTPTLDDLGLNNRCYFVDVNTIKPRVVEGEDMKKHSPARPANKYVLYRALTYVGGLTARQRNTSGVFSAN